MNRRDLLVAALGTALPPASARAQTSGRVYRIGWLDFSSAGENLGTFVQAMGARGWTEGKTFRVDYRGGEGKAERLATVAAELARMPVDVIMAPGTPETAAAKRATRTIPIVMGGVDDPVQRGLVGTLARPGANITGLATRLNGVSPTGPGRWLARCPAHEDRRASLSIRELDDGRVLVHDFAGCEAESVLGAVGLGFDALFPSRSVVDRISPERRAFPAADVLRAVGFEALIVAVAAENIAHGQELTKADHERLMTAAERITAAVRECGYA